MNADLACQQALDRLASVGFDALTEKEKALATVWKLQAAVENGGFRQYFSSAAGDLAFHAPAALGQIGARHMAELASKANAMTRLQQFLDGERDFDDAITVEEYVVPVTVHPDGTFTDEDGNCFGPHVE